MNNINYINESLLLIKNGQIEINSIVSEICTRICNEKGIPATYSIERFINELLIRYQRGEISYDVVIKGFDTIPALANTVRSGITSSNATKNTRTSNNTNNKAISETEKVNSISDENDDNTIVSDTNNSKVTNDKEILEPTEDINIIDNNQTNTANTTIIESSKKVLNSNEKTDTDVDKMASDSSKPTNEVESNVKTDELKGNAGTQKISSNNLSTSDSDSVNIDTVVDYDTDSIEVIADSCAEIDRNFLNTNIDIPGPMQKYASSVLSAVASLTSISSSVYDFVKMLWQGASSGEECDINSDIVELTIDNMVKNIHDYYDYSKNSTPIEVTEDFFNNSDYFKKYGRIEETKKGKFAVVEINGRECKYDMKNHKFYVDGKEAFDATIYVPSGADKSKYSELNTYTCFITSLYSDHIKDQKTNAIVMQITKQDKLWGNSKTASTKMDQTGMLTKFVNTIAGTKLDKKCKNAIGGESVYGTHSLKTAANNKGLYQTIYCINNAIISPAAGNNYLGEKTQMTGEEIKNLEIMAKETGLDIFFANVGGDPNLDHGKIYHNFSQKGGSFDMSYTYTGLKYLLDTCPSVKAYMVYPQNAPSAHNSENEMGIYAKLAKEYPNQFEYIPEEWSELANGDYQNHSGYESWGLPAEVAKHSYVNANNFNTTS